jgi:hypothetical protein
VLLTVQEQLDDEPLFLFAEQWIDGAHDPGSSTDLKPLANLEWLCTLEVAGRHDRLPSSKLVPVLRHHLYNDRPATTDR